MGLGLDRNDKGMAIMTNQLYIGIAGIIDDEWQIQSHQKNLLRLLESFRFGENDEDVDNNNNNNTSQEGIMYHDVLFSLILSIYGEIIPTPEIQHRWDRKWPVKVPMYDAYDVRLHFVLPPIMLKLLDQDIPYISAPTVSIRLEPWHNHLRQFRRNLDKFQSSARSWSREEQKSLEIIRQNIELLNIKARRPYAKTRDEFIRI